MNKLEFFEAITPIEAKTLLHVHANNFIKVEVVNAYGSEKVVQSLLANGFIEPSGTDALIVSETGMDAIIEAASKWADETNPNLLVAKATRTKRGVTDTMTKLADFTSDQLASIGLTVKGVSEDRSNLIVKFERVKSLKQVDIRRDGNVRIHAYNAEPKIVKAFTELGFRVKVGGKNTYIDNVLTEENIMHAINILRG